MKADLPQVIYHKPTEALGIRVPPLLERAGKDGRLHVFFLHSPIALIMATMIADAFRLPAGNILGISQRNTNIDMTGFATVPLTPGKYDRYVNRITGRNLAALRLRRMLRAKGHRFIVYAAWYYPEIEEIVRSPLCDGVIIFEEGQLSYHGGERYKDTFRNTWRFRRTRLHSGTTDLWFREDAAGFVALSPQAFPSVPEEQRFVLTNVEAAAGRYVPLLSGITSIGLMPAPRRLPAGAVYPAIQTLVSTMPGSGVIKLHPGYKFEPDFADRNYAGYVKQVSEGRVSLCPEDAIIELEMAHEAKILYGAQTSLSRYADIFGSRFVEVTFDSYIKPVI